MAPSKDKLTELESLISKMTVEACCITVLPELGVRWREVTRAVRNARLPMTSANIAKILKRHISKSLEPEEVEEIVAQLKLKFVASSNTRVWHAINLIDPIRQRDNAAAWSGLVPTRILNVARNTIKERNTSVQVHTTKMGSWMFLSIQKVSRQREGTPVYAALTDQPVAFLTSLGSTPLLKAVVQGLGFRSFENANLCGKDLTSLLRIVERSWNININQLTEPIEYDPRPIVTKNGIDFTNRSYNRNYVETIIGPDPPLLNTLDIKSKKEFFDPGRLNKNISVVLKLKSDDVSKTLKSWVDKKALAPTSEFLKIFHHIKSNDLNYDEM